MPSKQKSALIGALCAFVMVVTLGLSFLLSSNLFQNDDSSIQFSEQLQESDESGAMTDMGQENEKKIAQVTITPDNVQAVIASLQRPAAYTCEVSNTLYWDGGTRTLQCRQYARDGAYRVESLDGDTVTQVQLQYRDKLYAWEAGSATYYSGQAGSFTPEQAAMLPTYETVCELPPEQIEQAELIELSGQPMLRVVTAQGSYAAEYVISAATGLLYRTTFSKDGVRTQSVQTSVSSLDRPADPLFMLPGQEHTIFVDT